MAKINKFNISGFDLFFNTNEHSHEQIEWFANAVIYVFDNTYNCESGYTDTSILIPASMSTDGIVTITCRYEPKLIDANLMMPLLFERRKKAESICQLICDKNDANFEFTGSETYVTPVNQ